MVTPVTEESTMDRNSSHQIVSGNRDSSETETHLKTNDSSAYCEANSSDTALDQEEFPVVTFSSQPTFSFYY